MCPAIHINSRSWLRSSSTHEPSDPPPRVVFLCVSAAPTPARAGSPKGPGKQSKTKRAEFRKQPGWAGARRGRSTEDLPQRAGRQISLPGDPRSPSASGRRVGSHRVVRPSARRRQVPAPGFRGDSDRARAAGPPREDGSGGRRACRRQPSRLAREAPSGSGLRRAAAIPRPLPNTLPSTRRARPLDRNATGRRALLRDGWRVRATREGPISPFHGRVKVRADARKGRRRYALPHHPVPLRRSAGQRAARDEGPRARHGRL